MTNTEKPQIVGVGWLSDDKSYIKIKINFDTGPQEFIIKRSKLDKKTRPSQADYLIYPKPIDTLADINF